MGTLIYGFTTSVDGYIADAHGNIDWSDPSDELHQYWNDFERDTAMSFYGRRIYELMAGHWPAVHESADADPIAADFAAVWCNMPKVVFSSSLESVAWNSRLERGDPVEVVRRLKADTDGQLEVAGATLAAPIVRAGLVDEYRMVISPHRGRRWHIVLPDAAIVDAIATTGASSLSRRDGPAALRAARSVRLSAQRAGTSNTPPAHRVSTSWR
ncbi:Dihydrofolate reductase [Mycolicibacterium neoaurum]|nr:Dihydrofolate reductase [Mycolicibacterium neoaurum]